MTRADFGWGVLLNLGCLPLNVASWLLDALADLLHHAAWLINVLSWRWKVTVRRWSGRDATGRTRDEIAAAEARRETVLRAMRASRLHVLDPLDPTPARGGDDPRGGEG